MINRWCKKRLRGRGMQIRESTFLVSGGSSGLGAATVRLLAQSGGNVVIADLDPEGAKRVVQELAPRVQFVQTDVTEESSVQNAVRTALDSFGSLRGAVNCAGIGSAERVLGKAGPHSLSLFLKVIQVNLIGTFNILRLAAVAIAEAPPLADGERGVIVNTASVAAFDGQIGQAAYSASKGGVVGMTLPIARDLSRELIRVCTIAPGLFKTPLLGSLPEEAQRSLGAQVPHPARLGDPDEYGALAVHIVENPMLNAETIRLDGALRMPPK